MPPVEFSRDCVNCGKVVSRTMPPAFEGKPAIHIECARCGQNNWCPSTPADVPASHQR